MIELETMAFALIIIELFSRLMNDMEYYYWNTSLLAPWNMISPECINRLVQASPE